VATGMRLYSGSKEALRGHRHLRRARVLAHAVESLVRPSACQAGEQDRIHCFEWSTSAFASQPILSWAGMGHGAGGSGRRRRNRDREVSRGRSDAALAVYGCLVCQASDL
jgi:hypothetical protein